MLSGSFDHVHGLQQVDAFRHSLSQKLSFSGIIEDVYELLAHFMPVIAFH